MSFFCRPCVYTMGSPINNRALFPCQEPPVAMSTWQATVRAAASFVVLTSGENSAKPTQLREGTVHVFCTSFWVAHMLDPGTQDGLFFATLKSSFISWVGMNMLENILPEKTAGRRRSLWGAWAGVRGSSCQTYQFLEHFSGCFALVVCGPEVGGLG